MIRGILIFVSCLIFRNNCDMLWGDSTECHRNSYEELALCTLVEDALADTWTEKLKKF